jgi:hypothetical protein
MDENRKNIQVQKEQINNVLLLANFKKLSPLRIKGIWLKYGKKIFAGVSVTGSPFAASVVELALSKL